MDKVAFLTDSGYVYWHSVFIVLAILAAGLAALALALARGRNILATLAALPLSFAASLYLGRLIHWYCRFESYGSFSAAMGDMSTGGFSLIGVFLGVILACLLLRAVRLTRDLPGLLDIMAPAGALGVALGRLADLFTTADRGKMLVTNPALQRLPWAASVVNTAGGTEWRAATFCFQSIFAAALCLALLAAFFLRANRRYLREGWNTGNVAAAFLLLYCASQIVLDSTRYDALFLRSNGFVSLEQIICAVVLAAVLAMYSVRSLKARGFHLRHLVIWVLALACLGGAGYMEYYVQRHGDRYLLAYGVMSACLLAYVVLTMVTRRSTLRPVGLHRARRPARKSV